MTEFSLDEAIAKCNGKPDPFPDDALLMAACYIIKDHLYPSADAPGGYSLAAPPEIPQRYIAGPETVGDYGDSEFLQAIKGKNAADMWLVMDELVDTVRMLNPRIYDGVMQRIQ